MSPRRAANPCPTPGCPELQPCPTHPKIPWVGSTRRRRLPPKWEDKRARVLRRDGHRCTHTDPDGRRCPNQATDVDHIIAGDDHRDTNLTSLCRPHHATKSGREGQAARVVG